MRRKKSQYKVHFRRAIGTLFLLGPFEKHIEDFSELFLQGWIWKTIFCFGFISYCFPHYSNQLQDLHMPDLCVFLTVTPQPISVRWRSEPRKCQQGVIRELKPMWICPLSCG